MLCVECHHENPAEARFCNACGRRLSAPEQISERRQLTVLFADLVDSTKHASRFDPEDWSSVLRRYHAAAARCADEYDGHVAQYLGDGVMVYFGYPVSHEDSAARALRCALALRIALQPLNAELRHDFDVCLQIRIGVHTGPVVVERLGQKNKAESLALGNTPNIAARLQALAPPDGIVASKATLELAGPSAFDFADMGQQQLKGLSEPVASVQIHGLDISHDGAIEQPLSFVGRAEELAILERLWQRTVDGSTVVACVTGDPGIGKTRFLTEFRSRLPTTAHRWLQLRCSSFDNRSPFAPVIQCLRAYLLPDGADADDVAARLDAMGLAEPRLLSALYELLRLPFARDLPVIGSPIEKRELSMQGMLGLFESAASTQPLIVCVEDVHWADPSTLELLQRLAARQPPLSLLLLLTARGDAEHGFAAVERVPLSGLAPPEAAALMRQALGSSDNAVVMALTQRSDGVPLFVEELAKAIANSVDRKVDDIPASLHDLLRAQLDRLGDVRDTAHAGAILGREFGEDVLLSVTVTAPDVTRKHIQRLIGERVWSTPEPGRLSFRHALIQEEAYSSILRRDRRALHARVAETLIERFSETPLHVLAHHRGEAEQFEEAAKLWYRAADRAKRASANYEALDHLKRGLATLYKLPETAVRHRVESRYQLSLGQVYSVLKSLYDTQAVDAYRRARDLSVLIEDKPSLFASLASLQANSVTRERIEHSRELADQLFELARQMPPHFRSVSMVLSGMTEYAAGNITGALCFFEPIVQLLTGDGRREDAGPLAGLADAYLGPSYWMAGRVQHALTHADEALQRARAEGVPTKLADALNCSAQVHVFAGNAERVLSLGRELTALAQESNYNQQLLNARFIGGLGMCLAGDRNAGVAALLSANDSARFQGLDGYFSWYQHDIAGQLLRCGRTDEARAVIERAMAVLNEFGGGTNMPALLNHRAVLLLRDGDEVAAEEAWRAAFAGALDGGAFGWGAVVLEEFEMFLRERDRAPEADELRMQADVRSNRSEPARE